MKHTSLFPPLVLLPALLLAGLACGLPGPAGPTPVPGTPATPAILLPPEWTPTPAAPTPDVPDGWEEFRGGRVHLWLPGSFEGGDLEATQAQVLEGLRALGGEYSEMAQYIEDNPGAFVLWAVDTQRGPSGALSNVNVVQEQVPESVTLQAYLDASVDYLPTGLEILERGIVSVGGRQFGKLVITGSSGAVQRISVTYCIRDGDRFWSVNYSTDPTEFVARTATWETSIRSLRFGD